MSNKLDVEIFQVGSNNYFYCKSKKQMHLCPDELKGILLDKRSFDETIDESKRDCRNYYLKKYEYLLSNNYFEIKEPVRLKNRLDPSEIEHYIANSYRIVFEVTENCNLNCKYCGYGEYYTTHGVRKNNSIRFETAKTIIDFFFEKWKSKISLNHKKFNRLIQFYGGEPLLNFNVIKRIVEYTEKKDMMCRYSMTTNGMLLPKYMDFLAMHKFSLLISLDGPKINNKFRITKNNKNSFDTVFSNIKKLQKNHPIYFRENVRFNCVLNTTSNIDEINNFFMSNFSKKPELSEITAIGIAKEKKKDFLRIFKSRAKCLEESKFQTNHNLEKNPFYNDFVVFLFDFAPGFYYSYNQLLNGNFLDSEIQTGSCRPYINRIYVTASGKILHCNFIEPKYILGEVQNNNVIIIKGQVTSMYNDLLESIGEQCKKCYRVFSCRKCLFLNVHSKGEHFSCDGYLSKKGLNELLIEQIKYFENNRQLYSHIKNNLRLI